MQELNSSNSKLMMEFQSNYKKYGPGEEDRINKNIALHIFQQI